MPPVLKPLCGYPTLPSLAQPVTVPPLMLKPAIPPTSILVLRFSALLRDLVSRMFSMMSRISSTPMRESSTLVLTWARFTQESITPRFLPAMPPTELSAVSPPVTSQEVMVPLLTAERIPAVVLPLTRASTAIFSSVPLFSDTRAAVLSRDESMTAESVRSLTLPSGPMV